MQRLVRCSPRSRSPRRSRLRRPRARRRRLVSDALAELERRLAASAPEGLAERELVAEAEPRGNLLERQVAEAQQTRGLEQHAVEDQLLGGLAGELREDARQRAGRHAQLGRVMARLVARREVALQQLQELAVKLDVRAGGAAVLQLRLAPALRP